MSGHQIPGMRTSKAAPGHAWIELDQFERWLAERDQAVANHALTLETRVLDLEIRIGSVLDECNRWERIGGWTVRWLTDRIARAAVGRS